MLISTAITSSPLTSALSIRACSHHPLHRCHRCLHHRSYSRRPSKRFLFQPFIHLPVLRCASEPPFRTLVRIENFTANCRQRTSHVLFNLPVESNRSVRSFPPLHFKSGSAKFFAGTMHPVCLFQIPKHSRSHLCVLHSFFDDLTVLCLALLPASFSPLGRLKIFVVPPSQSRACTLRMRSVGYRIELDMWQSTVGTFGVQRSHFRADIFVYELPHNPIIWNDVFPHSKVAIGCVYSLKHFGHSISQSVNVPTHKFSHDPTHLRFFASSHLLQGHFPPKKLQVPCAYTFWFEYRRRMELNMHSTVPISYNLSVLGNYCVLQDRTSLTSSFGHSLPSFVTKNAWVVFPLPHLHCKVH